jgi:hypothetical protein
MFLMKKSITPPLNQNYVSSFSFNNAIDSEEIVKSSNFTTAGITYYITNTVIDPTTNQKLNLLSNTLYKVQVTTNRTLVYESAGTIDYTTGDISLKALLINSFQNSPGLTFTATSLSEDIYSKKNDIIQINTSTDLDIQIIDYNNR